MGVEDGECSSSTNRVGTHKDEFPKEEGVEPSDIEEDHSWIPDGRRCDTEFRQPPEPESHSDAPNVAPQVSLEGLILKITNAALKIGKKIGKGAQADIYAARYLGMDVVVKKFKLPITVQEYNSHGQWPTELFRTPQFYVCQLLGYVLEQEKNGTGHSISLVMLKYAGDLRKVINKEWPFKPQVALDIITQIAMGMKLLHDQGVTHNDIKAENILVHKARDNIPYALYIGDFENSRTNMGTGFWRPPEVFQALEARKNSESKSCSEPMPFSKPGDVYSFGMVCYEILTGNVPFEGHPKSDYGLVPAGNRPELPADLDVNLREMILKCWHGDPNARPTFDDICLELRQRAEAVEDVSVRSAVMTKFEVFDEFCKEKSGPEVKVCELKQMVQSLAQEYGSKTDFVRRGFELVACIEQFMFEFGSLSTSFIDTPVLPFSEWLNRMWLCNTVQFKRYEFVDVLPDIDPTYKIVKLVWELTGKISEGCEKSNWGEDDSKTAVEKKEMLEAFRDEQARQIRIQGQGFDPHLLSVQPLSKPKHLFQKAAEYGRRFLGL